ncbi:MAG: folylpolyglutamate synthase/dihydrofolate synthase family protein [Candidatus Latescibacterota bacterium]
MTEDGISDPEYREALNFLYSFVDYERSTKWKYDDGHFDLKRIRSLLEAIGNPHRHGWFVHVAGTNGKGSVSAMIASALRESGLATGLYTSPHLITFRERIRIDGAMISPEEVIAGVSRIRKPAEESDGLTFFDVWTALAFDYFAEREVDVSVVEVGMGGRLDSTNVITPAVSVITSVSLDHRGKLGSTTAEIAAEKAGIIKTGIPVVSAPQDEDVTRVLREKATEVGSEMIMIGKEVCCEETPGGLWYHGREWELERVSVPLRGSFQLENTAIALAALEILASRGYPVTSETARRGVEKVRWPGRLDVISTCPEVMVDGACNVGAMRTVSDYVAQRSPREKTIAVVALCSDKEVGPVLEILGKAASRFIVTQVNNPRAMPVSDLAKFVPSDVEYRIVPDPEKALGEAVSLAGREGFVIVTGSLYLVGETMKLYKAEEIEEI